MGHMGHMGHGSGGDGGYPAWWDLPCERAAAPLAPGTNSNPSIGGAFVSQPFHTSSRRLPPLFV